MIHLHLIISFGFLLSPIIVFPKTIINDVTNINPIEINQVIVPTTTEEIINTVKKNNGPISIGGGRFSMGGANCY